MRARLIVLLAIPTACAASPTPAPVRPAPPEGAAASTAPAPPAARSPAQSFADPAEPVPVFADPQRKAKLMAAAPKLEAHFERYAARTRIPGLAAGLIVDGELAWSKGYGVRDLTTKAPVDGDTLFRLASLTKSFTAMAMLQLRDAGKLSLDDAAERYLPELAGVVYPTRDAPRITLRNLLTHTAGLPHDSPAQADGTRRRTEDDMVQGLRGMPLDRAPGTAYSYSNLGFHLAGQIVARISGESYADYVTGHILRPLGMTSSSFEPPADRLASGHVLHDGALRHPPMIDTGPSPAGGLFSSVRDMARYAAFELAAWPPRDEADDGPLRRSSVREAQRMSTWEDLYVPARDPGKEQRGRARGYGFGWVAEQTCDWDTVVWHNGALTDGYRSMLLLLPDRGVGLVALANLFDGDMDFEGAVREGMHLLEDSGALAPRVLQPTQALLAVRDTVMSLQDHWDPAVALRTFREPTEVLAQMEKVFADGLRQHGACHVTSTTATAATRLAWEAACDRGGEEWQLVLDPKSGRITSIEGDDRFPPDPRLSKAAAALAGLVARWDDRVYDAQVSPSVDRSEVKKVLTAAGSDHGSCKVDHADERGDKLHARFVLSCTRGGEVQLGATLDDRSGKVTALTLTAPEQPGKRCP